MRMNEKLTNITAETTVDASCDMWPLEMRQTVGNAVPWKRILENRYVHAVAPCEEGVFVACGKDGISLLAAEDFRELARIPCADTARKVIWHAPYLYTAEGLAGFAVYEKKGSTLEPVYRYSPYGRAVEDLQFSGSGKTLIMQVASMGVVMMDMSDPAKPVHAGEKLDFIGLFYGRHFPSVGIGEECYLTVNHDGAYRLWQENGVMRLENLPLPEGVSHLGGGGTLETVNGRLIGLAHEGYFWKDAHPRMMQIENCPFAGGKLRIDGDLAVIARRQWGEVAFFRLDGDELKCLCVWETTLSPDIAGFDKTHIYVPGGHQGLVVFDRTALEK